MLPYHQRLSFEQRQREHDRISHSHPNHVPVIVSRGTRDIPALDKEKFLVPSAVTAAQLTYIVRRRLVLDPSRHAYCNGLVVSGTTTSVRELHQKHADPDGFLYVTYAFENAFG